MEPGVYGVAFVRARDSARSIMAEGITNGLDRGRVRPSPATSHATGLNRVDISRTIE
jgi:hypothetical protein